MHYILSEINSKKDIIPVLNKMIKQGLISGIEKPELEQKINELLENTILKKYFSGDLISKNEAEIITDTSGQTGTAG